MASDNNDNRNSSKPPKPEENPFISFRRFADEQVSSLLHTVLGLPSTIAAGNSERHQCPYSNRNRQVNTMRREDTQAERKERDEEDKIDRMLRELDEASERGWRELQKALEDAEKADKENREKDPAQPKVWTWHWNWSYPPQKNETESYDRRSLERRCGDWELSSKNSREESGKGQDKEEAQGGEPRNPKVKTWHWSWGYPSRSSGTTGHESSHNDDEVEDAEWVRPWHRRYSCSHHWRNDPTLQPDQHFENADRMFDETFGIFNHTHRPSMMSPGFLGAMHYLQYNPYSPLRLEEDSQLSKTRVPWRDAFEDLVRAERGQPLLSREELGKSSQTHQMDWMRGLWERGSFRRPQFQDWNACNTRPTREDEARRAFPDFEPNEELQEFDEHEAYEYSHDHEEHPDDPYDRSNPCPEAHTEAETNGPETELDAYERLIGPTEFTPHSTASAAAAVTSTNQSQNADSRPSILSTLTTTERTIQPDGTITTKVVLKKRFADGREESSETVHTQRGQGQSGQDADTAWREMRNAQFPIHEKKPEKESKTGGWFWSGK
ncbi:hypothetical protein AOQ84DRAFT_382876 [Glonium stellatum]|uniref:Uncharacterized protein n=1 Tax=Glonium stellatum TaxID=574774 RepID=A0A8E2EP82_9PEZI|nr:hypothetical protein AOQ84DRAFT_382876 [Glonium stellatum]